MSAPRPPIPGTPRSASHPAPVKRTLKSVMLCGPMMLLYWEYALAVASEAGALTDACGEHGMVLAYGAHKRLQLSRGSQAIRRDLFGPESGRGEVSVLREHTGHAKLPLVAAFKHLGTHQMPEGSLALEVRFRAAQARAAYHEGRRKIVARKGHILRSLVLSRLTQRAGAWPPMPRKDKQVLDTAVWQFYRGILCVPLCATRLRDCLHPTPCCERAGCNTCVILYGRDQTSFGQPSVQTAHIPSSSQLICDGCTAGYETRPN